MNNKNYKFALLLSCLFATKGFAQVKVGDAPTTINANSVLEIQSTNKGLLLPRIALTATNAAAPLTAHIAGMTVYNTATAGTAPNDVTPGYFYNDGTQWVKISATSDIKEPWYNVATNAGATANTQDIYQMGKVGIGTTAPAHQLTVIQGTDGIITQMRRTGGTNNPGLWFSLTEATSIADINASGSLNEAMTLSTDATPRIYISSAINNGNVGIGTTAPTAKLTVSKNAAPLAAVPAKTVAHFANVDGVSTFALIDHYKAATDNNAVLQLRAAVGTAAAPTAITTAQGGLGRIIYSGMGATTYGTGATIDANASENWTDAARGTNLTFRTTNNGSIVDNPNMFIQHDGNVGIGTTSPTYKLDVIQATAGDILHVRNSANAFEAILGTNANSSYLEAGNTDLAFSTNGVESMRINTTTKNVGIGTTTPGSKLAVVGLPVFADNTAAASLSVGDFYRTSTGVVMVRY